MTLNDIQEQCKILTQVVRQAINLSPKNYDMEVLLYYTNGININTRNGYIENIEFNNNNLLNITVYKNNHKGNASSTDVSLKSIKSTINSAIDIANYTSSDKCLGIAEMHLLAFNIPDLNLYHYWNNDVNYALDLAIRAEKTALNVDKRIINTEGSNFTNEIGIKIFGNTLGMLQSYYFSTFYLSSCVIAEQNNNMERDYSYTIARNIKDLTCPEKIGTECANRALSRLLSKKISSKKAPVIFASNIANSLFKHLIHAINGTNVYNQSTFLLNDMEQCIFPKWLSIIEYPHILKGLGSAPFDNEGVLSNQIQIVQNGVLKSWLLNSYTARKLELKNTGHSNGIYNWIISNHDIEFNKLLNIMQNGLLITELMGHGVNIMNGDYSRGATGFWIENGEIKYPVSEITVAGNLKTMWKSIVSISNDLDKRSNIQSGSILIEEMQIAGK